MDWDAVDPLYDRRPEEFVAARNALAKELRAAGDKAAAAEVAKLRRPTATAYALNQLARHRSEVLADALEARAVLRAATEGAGRGEATSLREATAADREATRAVVAAAREVLGGGDADLAQRVTGTLLAAVLDPDVDATLRAGRLAAEQDASALAFSTGSAGGTRTEDRPMAPVVSLTERAEAKRSKRSREDAAAEREAAKAEEAAAKAEAAAAEEAARARRRERVEREQLVGRLERRVARLQGKVAEIEEELAAARAELGETEQELEESRQALAEVPDPG